MVSTAHLPVFIFTWTVCFSPGMTARFVTPPCDQNMFGFNVGNCLLDFNNSMVTSGFQEECPWPHVKRDYYKLKLCVDHWANVSWCTGYKFLVDDVFLMVHQMYFSLCGEADPPLFTLIMLTAPVIITTLFLPLLCVHLTTWNT